MTCRDLIHISSKKDINDIANFFLVASDEEFQKTSDLCKRFAANEGLALQQKLKEREKSKQLVLFFYQYILCAYTQDWNRSVWCLISFILMQTQRFFAEK